MAAKKKQQDDLKKLIEERAALKAEFEKLSAAQTPQNAVKEILSFVSATQEPFFDQNPATNSWLGQPGGSGGC